MEEENEYEAARLRQIAANKAKLQSLGVSAAVEAVAAPLKARREQAAAAKRAKHATSTEAATVAQRRTSGRTAAVNARSKLREQTVSSPSGSGGASTSKSQSHSASEASAAASGDMESDVSVVSDATEDEATSSGLPKRRPGAKDPTNGARSAARSSKHRSTAREGRSTGAGYDNVNEDEELQRALQLSLADIAHTAYQPARSAPAQQERPGRDPEDVPAGSCQTADRSDPKQPNSVSQTGVNGSIQTSGKSGAKKRSRAGKAGRAPPAPPTDAELAAVFSMLNPKGMSAIIGSDIKQVASEVLLIEHEPEQLQNMMVRACELLGLQQQRLEPEAFLELARHYLG